MSSSSRKVLFFILLVALAYVSYAYMIKPANRHLTDQRAKVSQKQAKLAELQRATAAAVDLNKQLQKVEQAIQTFESKLPPTSEIDNVLTDITVIAQKQNLTPKSIRTQKSKDNRGYIEQPLEMELEGNFQSYYAFLLELEKLDRITKIRELSLKKKNKFEGHTEARFVVSVFFQNSGA
jgi:type IV pilus assembly protein PilO